jgi:hypothetical protein
MFVGFILLYSFQLLFYSNTTEVFCNAIDFGVHSFTVKISSASFEKM